MSQNIPKYSECASLKVCDRVKDPELSISIYIQPNGMVNPRDPQPFCECRKTTIGTVHFVWHTDVPWPTLECFFGWAHERISESEGRPTYPNRTWPNQESAPLKTKFFAAGGIEAKKKLAKSVRDVLIGALWASWTGAQSDVPEDVQGVNLQVYLLMNSMRSFKLRALASFKTFKPFKHNIQVLFSRWLPIW